MVMNDSLMLSRVPVSPALNSSWMSPEYPAASGDSLGMKATSTAMMAVKIGGMRNIQRQSSLATTNAPTVNPARMIGARLLMANWPDWIIRPKMPANVPRSVRLNHAALILIIPGAPNDWKYPLISQMSAKVENVPTVEEKP